MPPGHREGVGLSSQVDLGKIHRAPSVDPRLVAVRLLLPVGWTLAAIGFFGPWIAHDTSALTLSGVDMGEFVKFLPEALDSSLNVVRQMFYLPPFAVVVSVAFLAGSQRVSYPRWVCVLMIVLAVPISLQLLPPAWSPASLVTTEFRLQTIAMGLCWLLLATFWLLGRLPSWLTGALTAALSLAAAVLSTWQFLTVKSAIDRVYRTPQAIGWGYFVCMAGLMVMAAMGVVLVLQARQRRAGVWMNS